MICEKCIHSSTCNKEFIVNNKCDNFHKKITHCDNCKFKREMDKYERKIYSNEYVLCSKHIVGHFILPMKRTDFCSYGIEE